MVGDPQSCSQCRGAVPRVVSRDPATGALTVDGVAQDRPYALGASEKAAAYYRRGARASGRAKLKR